jgi:hypothetical protein
VGQEFRLNEFKVLYGKWKTLNPVLDHFLFSILWWLEEQLIECRVKVEVDEAIKTWDSLQPVDDQQPIYSETGSGFFDEMRLTAPHHVRSND